MDITSGPAQVIAHGMVTTFLGNPLRLSFAESAVVELVFHTTPEAPEVRIELEWTSEGLRLLLYNFDRPDGRGSREPALIGELEDDLLFFHFRVLRWGNTDDRTVHYTFYKVAKDQVTVDTAD